MSSALHDEHRALTEHRENDGRRIAVIVTRLTGGDAEHIGVDRLRWLADAGYDVTVVPVSADPADPSADLPDAVTVRYPDADAGRNGKVRSIRRLLSETPFDVVLALQTEPNLLAVEAVAALAPRPILVLTELELLTSGLARPGITAMRRIRRARRAYADADLVIGSSHPISAEMSAAFGVPASRSLVVHDPVLPAAAQRVARSADPSAAIELVIASPLVASTRPHLAILAAQELNSRGVPTNVVAQAGGPLAREVAALAKRSDVTFTVSPHGEEWAARLAPNAVVLLPHRAVGLGRVLIDAAAHGVPSVGISTALGVADALIPGITGELAFDDSPSAIADAVHAAARLEVTGIEDWLDRFSSAASGAVLGRALDYAAAQRVAA
ncbi:glycosyltransferase involved in cell wall biosynthesis [Microbacterium sp. AG1240]|uniref:glycosyltransferase n=1 Tax=Microbacterium sp. AG1240 TaxID=2183992 RepID=UPI000EAD223A|nr:glycosyltransferase [Microbacterium sp. AG1240]RKT36040.1 glycosyltransferase involved in cell wall biosynthesis [Microbacterium sp. AG1240]